MRAMRRVMTALGVAAALAGCAATEPRAVTAPEAAGPGTFTGEVWTWDTATSTVTLRQVDRTVRVKVSADQLAQLRLYQMATVTGVPEGMPIAEGPVAMQPVGLRGPADQLEVAGTVTAVDAAGKLRITSARGPVEVWTGNPGQSVFRPGEAVRVRLQVQPFEMAPVPASPATAPPAVTVPPPQVPAAEGPGEYAVVRGHVLGVDAAGRLTVESPRGPIVVPVPAAARYRLGDLVEVRSAVQPPR